MNDAYSVRVGRSRSPCLSRPCGPRTPLKTSPARVVTKTLVVSEAQKECLSLNNRQRLHYKFRADGPLNFKVSHQEEKEIIDFKRDGTDSASGSFVPRKRGRSLSRWSNTGKHSGDSSLRVPARFAVNPQRRARGPRRRF